MPDVSMLNCPLISSYFGVVCGVFIQVIFSLFVACLVVMFVSHYWSLGVQKPMFIGGQGRMKTVLDLVSSKTGVYRGTSWSVGGHLQTVVGHLFKTRVKVKYASEHIETPDGSVLKLDWSYCDQAGNNKDSRGIVLILPGITGSSQENYSLHFSDIAKNQGYHAVVMNYRGIGALARSYRLYCASNSEDLELTLKHIGKKFPQSPICAVGVSLGGLILTNYLVKMGSTDHDSFLHAAFIVSIPWDLFIADRSFIKPLTWLLFNRRITRKLQELFSVNLAALRAQDVAVPHGVEAAAAKANTLREFDDAVIAPMFGFRDVSDYYAASCVCRKSFECIKTPLLCLNAADDPFSPYEQIPVERIKNCENVAMILTDTGGHVAFPEGFFPYGHGYMDRVYKEYITAVFDSL